MSDYLFVILLGLIQGFTEFLPISSSGHLALLENISYFHVMTSEIEKEFSLLTFNVILHIGTIMAVLIFWRKEIISIATGFFRSLATGDFNGEGFITGKTIIIATLPIIVVPFVKSYVEHATETLGWIALFFIYNGFLLIISDFLFHRKKESPEKEITKLTIKDALIIGFFQLSAIFPGISRSGSTITAGLLRGMRGPEAVKFSFIMSIPVLIAAAGLELLELKSTGLSGHIRWDWIIAGLTSSFLAGILSLKALVWLGKKVLFYPFGIYTMILGIVITIFYR